MPSPGSATKKTAPPIPKELEDPFFFLQLFEHIPGIECFIKDTLARRIRVTPGIWKRLGLSSEEEMLGKTDHEMFPAHIADQYARSDQQVIQSGEPLLGITELWINEQGAIDWFVTHKYPIKNKAGRVVGIVGTLRQASTTQRADSANSPLEKVVEFIRQNATRDCSLAVLSKVAGLSERQLRRRFQGEFGIGLSDFILKTKTHLAAKLLVETTEPIAEIALESGFCDQSAFTRAFRNKMGMPPAEYRKRYRPKSHLGI